MDINEDGSQASYPTNTLYASAAPPKPHNLTITETGEWIYDPPLHTCISDYAEERSYIDGGLENGNIYYLHFKSRGLWQMYMNNNWIYQFTQAKIYVGDNVRSSKMIELTSGVSFVQIFGQPVPMSFDEKDCEMIVDLTGVPTMFLIVNNNIFGCAYVPSGDINLSFNVSKSIKLISGPMPPSTWEAYMTSRNSYSN
jgi:hypothetical protein